MERKCPNGGAMMTADVKRGLWVCGMHDCVTIRAEQAGDEGEQVAISCIGNEEYQEPMSPAEVMQATGAERLL